MTDDSVSVPATHKGKTAVAWYVRYLKEHQALSRHGEMVRAARREVRLLSQQLEVRGGSLPIMAIRLVFGSYADQAIRVSFCETGGTFSTYATNGQYLGLFQMGNYARGRYGHSDSALGPAQAAYRYFVESGRDWSPWECKP